MRYRSLIMTAAIAMVATSAFGQQPTAFSVRLEKGDRNTSACTTLDAAMSRPHTVTITGDTAVVKSNGGIDDKAKQTRPGIYTTKFSVSGGLSNATLDIVVDTTVSPPTLTATEAKIGCKWSGKAA